MTNMFGPIGIITAIGVSAILGWFEFALLDSRLRDDGRFAGGSASDTNLPGHGRELEEGCNCSDSE